MGCFMKKDEMKKKLLAHADNIYNLTVENKVHEAMGECLKYIKEGVNNVYRR